MANVKIRVESVSEEELSAQQQGQEISNRKDGVEKLAVASIFAHQGIAMTKQIVSAGISNIGNFTGNYVAQDRAQRVVSVLGDVVGIASAFAVSPVAGSVALVGLAIKEGASAISDIQKQRRADREAEYLVRISGNSTTNGSRTGE